MLTGYCPSHFFSMHDIILAVLCSLQFRIDCRRLTSERTFLMNWASWSYSSKSGSKHLWLREIDAAASRQRLMVL